MTIVLRRWSEIREYDYPVALLILYSGTGIGCELASTPPPSFSNDGLTAGENMTTCPDSLPAGKLSEFPVSIPITDGLYGRR
ncbi:hypothetical protein K439DRAFT_1637406 [Ramaria rubella]|nr:hypothetical protein K439DRAFT_1637406 [Ramaria rubella]